MIAEVVRDYIRNTFYVSEKFSEIDPDLSLMESGIIDSTGILEVIEFLEERFGIDIDNSEIVPQNLDSLNSIADYVQRKSIGGGGLR